MRVFVLGGRALRDTARRLTAIGVVAVCLPRALSAATTPTVSLPHGSARLERLQSQGLETGTDALIRFLEQGFGEGTRLSQLPGRPALKTQVAIDAMVMLSQRQAAEAAPVFERLVRGDVARGLETLIQWDVSQQRPEFRVEFEKNLRRTLRLNAMVALGLVGEMKNAYALILEFKDQKDPDIKIPCALALATLGSGTGITYLIGEVRKANRTSTVAAGDALRLITGQNYGPGADDPVSRRRQAAKDWKTWWKREGKTFLPDRNDILARRMMPPIRPNRREPKTVRELLDCMVYPENIRWTIDAYEAHERVRAGGAASMDELEQIVKDKSANLKIRRQAIILYSLLAPLISGTGDSSKGGTRRPYKLIRALRWDRNPEIREVAADCARRLREAR